MKASLKYSLAGAAALGFLPVAFAMDDYLPPVDGPKPLSTYEKAFSGEVYAGYQSRYQYKNIVATPYMNSSGLFDLGARFDLPLKNWKQHITADYAALFDGRLNDRNVFNAGWSADREILPNLKAGAGYSLNYGGLPGFVAKERGKAPHSLAQSFDGFVTYDDPGTGYFGMFDVQGGFYGLTGWRFDLEAGKRWEALIHKRVDLLVSGGLGLSTSYWGSGIDGVDQLNIKVAAPIRISLSSEEKGMKITPFVQFVWAGNTRSDINRSCGYRVIDKFQIVGGIGVSYNF